MSEMEQDDSKKDLSLILTRLSNLIAADAQKALNDVSSGDNTHEDFDDEDDNYPELTEIADIEMIQKSQQDVDEAILNPLMLVLTPAIDEAVNLAVKRILLEAKQPLKQQLTRDIQQALLKLLK